MLNPKPMMERRHFELIASVIASLSDNSFIDPRSREQVAKEFSRKLSHTNPSFNRDRFLRACGVED